MKSKGQALVEYVLIITIISVIAIIVAGVFGSQIKDKVTEISCSLTDKTYVSGKEVGQGKCK